MMKKNVWGMMKNFKIILTEKKLIIRYLNKQYNIIKSIISTAKIIILTE